jgi:hypothetical protein
MNQTTFVEPLKITKRKVTAPEKIAAKLKKLADWYRENKPDQRSMTIMADDAFSIRTLWKKKDSRHDGEMECRMAGFNMSDTGELSWRGFDLIEAAG